MITTIETEHREDILREALRLRSGLEVKLAEVEDGKTGQRRFSMVANSGIPILNHWYWNTLAFDMLGFKPGRQARPALREHESALIAGHTDKLTASEADGLIAEGLITPDTVTGAEIIKLADAKYPWECSIHFRGMRIERLEEGGSVIVNGHKIDGPATIFREWDIREVSFCALGADEHTSAEVLSGGCRKDTVAMTFTEVERRREEMAEKKKGTEKKDAPAASAPPAETPPAPEVKAPDGSAPAAPGAGDTPPDTRIAGEAAERARVISIIDASLPGTEKLARDLIARGTGAEEAGLLLKELKRHTLAATAPASPGPSGESTERGGDDSKLSDEEKDKKAYANSEKLKAEFPEEADYLALRRGERSGAVSAKE